MLSIAPPFQPHPFAQTPDLQFANQIGDVALHQTPDPRFNDNLVKYISRGELERIGSQLTESITSDDRDRQKWLRILTQGISQLGIGSDRAHSTSTDYDKDTDLYAATFLTECLKITCKLFSTLFPGKKFSQTETYGFVTKAIEDQAFRTGEFFNFYTNEVMTEYIPDSEQAIWWSVLGGSSFVKPYFDPHKGRIVAPYIQPQDVIISSGASSIYDAERVTHRFTLTKRQMEANFDSNIWIRSSRIEENSQYTDHVTRKVNQTIGIEPTANDQNENYMFDECYTFLKINGFEEMNAQGQPTARYLPYRVIKDKNSNVIVGIWRNYDEYDHLFKPKINIIQHKYFTGFNAYGLGMIHLALGCAKTETKIQQQLIKGAILSNMPNLIQKSGLRTEKTQLNFVPGSIQQIATFGEPLQNAFMPMPFQPPSPVMMDLKSSCSRDIQNISIAREIKAEDVPANTSATTILGILSTTTDMSNSLIRSYYRSYGREFQLIFNLLGEILPDKPYPFLTQAGEMAVMRQDFSPQIKIIPVMDPSNSSQSMQIMTNEILMTISAQNPQFYNQREIQKRILNTLKIQDIDTILVPDPSDQPPPQIDAVSENMRVYQQVPIKAYKNQDHPSHLTIHNNELVSLTNDQSKDNSQFIAALQAHITEHEMWEYARQIEAASGIQIPDDPTQIPPDVQDQISMRIAQALEQQQQQEQAQNPPPMDPSIPLMEENRVKEKGIELEFQYKQEQIQTEQLKISKETEREEMEIQLRMRELEIEERRLMLEERKMMIQEQEAERKYDIELKKIDVDQQKASLQVEAKSYGDTLKYENDQSKTALDAQSKAFDSVMTHEHVPESENQKESKNDTTHGKK